MGRIRTHRLVCKACGYVLFVRSGDLPTQCPHAGTHDPEGPGQAIWIVASGYEWDLRDLRTLRALGISPE
jgi:hypothetical protein